MTVCARSKKCGLGNGKQAGEWTPYNVERKAVKMTKMKARA
jgi:hypothetical protein